MPTLDVIWWIIGAVAVGLILWKFGVQAALFGALALFGIKILRDERERGAADQRSQDERELQGVRDDWQEINSRPHSPDDAYDHLRGLHDERKD